MGNIDVSVEADNPTESDNTDQTETAALDAAVASASEAGKAEAHSEHSEDAAERATSEARLADSAANAATTAAIDAQQAAEQATAAAGSAAITLDAVHAAIQDLPQRIKEALTDPPIDENNPDGGLEIEMDTGEPTIDEPPRRNWLVDKWFGNQS